ncbi:MAG: Dyp-type peroxidase, partial [Acidimicrobiales bacterium]
FQRWTAIAANLTAGRPAAPMTSDPSAVEPDSGETLGLGPARLTINFGFGPALFGVGAPDRLGLRSRWPEPLVNLPSFPGDDLVESRTGGDLTIHACADDPQVAFHAVRQLVRAAKGTASVRWSQAGFNEAAATTGTPRNLTGFKDGTANPTSQFDIEQFIWVGAEDQAWMVGGTYVVTRRIRIALDRWDASALEDQERAIGRSKVTGAPLGRSAEHDSLDLAARNADGTPVMPLDAHVRLASPDDNWGQMMLRRSYSYDDGVDMLAGRHPSQGEVPALDAGLFFVSYQRNPRLAFIPMFDKLSRHDALRHFTIHTGSAIAAIPPAASAPGDWVGRELLES